MNLREAVGLSVLLTSLPLVGQGNPWHSMAFRSHQLSICALCWSSPWRRALSRVVFASALLLLFLVPISQSQTANCTQWKFFRPPAPWNATFGPGGINRWGTVVGNASQDPSSPGSAFVRYSGGGFTTYKAPNATATVFNRRNKFAVNAGWYMDNAGKAHGLVVSGSQHATVDYPGAPNTELNGLNNWGTVVGWHYDQSTGAFDGFKLKNGTFTRIHYPNSSGTKPWSINEKGVVVGSYFAAFNDRHGFVRENGVYKTLDNSKPGASETTLTDINGSGTIVGFYYLGSIAQSFLYSNGVFKDVLPPNANYTIVTGINAFGYVVGTTNLSSGGFMMFTAHCQ